MSCRWSSARARWEVEVRPGVSKEPCGHDHPGRCAATDQTQRPGAALLTHECGLPGDGHTEHVCDRDGCSHRWRTPGTYANAASFDFAVAWENDADLSWLVLSAASLLDPAADDEVVGAWVLGIVTGTQALSPRLHALVGGIDLLEVDRAELGGVIRDALRDGAFTATTPEGVAALARWTR